MTDINKIKVDLIEEYFDIDGIYNLKENKKIESKLKDFIKKHGYDRQLEAILKIIKMSKESLKLANFKTRCDTVAPVLKELDNLRELDIYDIDIFIICIAATYDVKHGLVMIERVIDILDKQYINESFYEDYIVNIYANFLGCVLLFHCYASEEEKEKAGSESIFKYIEVKLLKMCSKNPKYILKKAVVFIRQGIFYANDDIIDDGFEIIKEHGKEDLYHIMELERDACKYYTENLFTKKILRFHIAETLRAKRKLLTDKTADELSLKLGFEPHVLGQVERGDREAPLLLLVNFSKEVNISLDKLIKGEVSNQNSDEDTVNQITEIATSLDPKTAKVLLNVTKGFTYSVD